MAICVLDGNDSDFAICTTGHGSRNLTMSEAADIVERWKSSRPGVIAVQVSDAMLTRLIHSSLKFRVTKEILRSAPLP